MSKKKNGKLGLICDIAFELVLVLLVLLVAMLLSKNDVIAGPDGYHVDILSLFLTFGLIIFYIIFLVRSSLKELDDKEENKEDKP